MPARHLSFTSTDLDLTLLSQAEAKVSRPGSVTVPARKLFDLIRNLPEADVLLKLMDNHYLGVTCQRSSFRLVAQPAEDFPTVPKVEAKKGVSFPLDLWKRLTRKVLYAVSAEATHLERAGGSTGIYGFQAPRSRPASTIPKAESHTAAFVSAGSNKADARSQVGCREDRSYYRSRKELLDARKEDKARSGLSEARRN